MKPNYQVKIFIPEGLTCKSPYVYGMRHKPSMKLYIGKKYAEASCDSSTFMTENGYQTSSEYVKERIVADGLDSFEVLFIRHFETISEVTAYEKNFLTIIDAKNHHRYFNKHNGGTGHGPHTDETKRKMSEASKGKPKSDNARKNMSIAHLGVALSEEHKQALSKGQQNRSPDQRVLESRRKRDVYKNRSLEKEENRLQKIRDTFNNKSDEIIKEIKQKLRDANTGLRLYDKVGEKSKKFKEQPEDPTWILRVTQRDQLYDKPGNRSKRFKEQPDDLTWIPRR